MKKKLLILLIILVSFNTIQSLVAQQIGEGYAPSIPDFSNILTSGVYGGAGANGATPDNSYGGWQHLLVIRHENPNNNHQFQLATSYSVNDRLFFRKIAGGLSPIHTEWNELATRGGNIFSGNQDINGTIKSSNVIYSTHDGYAPTYLKSWGLSGTGDIYIEPAESQNLFLTDSWSRTGMLNIQFAKTVFESGNVLIGKTSQENPDYKLDVEGFIRATAVIINTTGADFVFEPTYKLRPLAEVETFIKANKHLPEVAPAAEMQTNGVSMGEMQTKLLQKVEELTLYSIEQDKKLQELGQKNEVLEQELKELKELLMKKLK